jgi:replicative DNA helicase
MTDEQPRITFESVDERTFHRLYQWNEQPLDIVPSPIPKWNRMCRDEGGGVGLAHGWHITIGAKTGSGKSVFGLNMAAAAMRAGHKVGFLSLEMSFRQLLTRALAIVTQQNIQRLEPGTDYNPQEFQNAAQEWENRIPGLLFVNREPIVSLKDIVQSMWVLHEEHGVRVFIVDYLQLAWVAAAKTLFDQITEVSHKVRELSHRYTLLTLGLSQFNRETCKELKLPPEPSGLMGGSPLENDSDQVILVDHTSYKQQGPRSGTQKLLIAKNRHGPKGWIAIGWDWETLTAYELQDEHEAVAQYKEKDDDLPF